MSASTAPPFETLLKMIAQSAPQPWYAVDFVNEMGVAREKIDGPLDQLRVAGLIVFTPWVSGKGQGYEITRHGQTVLNSPRMLAGLRRGKVPTDGEPEPEYDHDPSLAGTSLARGEIVIRALRGEKKTRVAKVLIALNFVVFGVGLLLMFRFNEPMNLQTLLFRGSARAAHATGSVNGGAILNGEWWRLGTNMFVHHGLVHIGLNMYYLWFLASLTERLWGPTRFLTIYLLAGFGGSCFAIWHDANMGLGGLAGASGALCGLMSSYLVWLVLNRRYLPRADFNDALRYVTWMALMVVFVSWLPGVSWTGHLGGGVVGAVVAALLNFHRFGRDPFRWMYIGLVAIVPVACVGLLIRAKESDPRWRKGANESLQKMQGVNDEADRLDFNKTLLKVIEQARIDGKKAIREADIYRSSNPALNRQAAKVNELVENLTAAQNKLRDAERACENSKLYGSVQVNRALTAARDLLPKERAVLEHLERCLQAGAAWTDGDDESLNKAFSKMKDSEESYLKVLEGE
jgi:membrane associated rhomboid family serine protease